MTTAATINFCNFQDFTDFVVRKLEHVYGSNADIVFYKAKSSGMLNDYYEAPEWWTDEKASRLCLTICAEERKARQVLASYREYFLGSLYESED